MFGGDLAFSFTFIFISFWQLCWADLNVSSSLTNDTLETISHDTEISILKWKITKKPLKKFKIRKRTSHKNLGEKCSSFRDCPPTALCVSGLCSCPYDYYNYSPQDSSDSVCRKKVKFGFSCTLSEDCLGYDSNSACSDSVCKCINGTHYIGSRNLLSHNKRCYKILEREGDLCDIDEQCSRLADNLHKCRCIGRCDCDTINRFSGCSICHENIKRTFFGGAAFIIILLSSRVFTKMRHRTSSVARQQRQLHQRCYRLNTSRTVPSVSARSLGIGHRRHSLPDVFLVDRGMIGISASATTDFCHRSGGALPARGVAEDAPPSYDDIVWSEPPPAYHEVASKNP